MVLNYMSEFLLSFRKLSVLLCFVCMLVTEFQLSQLLLNLNVL